jgi:hypothetical protein
MSQPTYLGGPVPLRTDSRLRVETKLLGAYQNKAGALAHNNPVRTDTRRIIRLKTLRSVKGI